MATRAEKAIKIIKESVVDRKGNVIANKPEDVPELANRCKAISETIKTGQVYKVED